MSERIVSLHAFYRAGASQVEAYLSHPTAPGPWPGVVIAHEWWGLDEHFRDFSRELASHGFAVLVPDLYHGQVTAERAEAATLKASLEIDRAVDEMVAGGEYLRDLPFVGDQVAVIGFCMGGGVALLAACRAQVYETGVIYFPSIYPDAAELENLSCPLLFHYGTADPITPRSEIDRITRTLDAAGKTYELELHEGAKHAFVNDMHPENYSEPATRASWPQTVEFLKRHMAG